MAERAKKSLAGSKGPPKPKKVKKTGNNDEREDTLQAVLEVLADSYETRFNPFSVEKPRCLLPLANTPLIEYTLEFLALSGISEIYVYCGAHTQEVEAYLVASKWHPATSPSSPFSTLEILKSAARSVGDALRDIDNRSIITGDFLLVYGDLVSNIQIDSALSAHKARRIADKNAIMTMVLRDGGLRPHRTKSQGLIPVFITDPTKNRCLHYEEISPLQANKYINIDPTLLSDHMDMEIRADLIDCGIDICTPDVLALWSDSFDYEIPRKHFLHGVLKDYELNGKTIHTEIITDHYAARASNLQEYEAISKDVLGRWTYPLVPDSNLMHGQSYIYSRGGICKEEGVVLARSCKIGYKTVIGRDTSVGDYSIVKNSIIGQRCLIGKNVVIENAFIWDDVVVGDGTKIDRAILANEVVIGQNCIIKPGALLSFSVRISEGMTVEEASRITRAKRKRADMNDEALSDVPPDPKIVGDSGQGYAFDDPDEVDEDDETVLQNSLIYSTSHLNISTESVSTLSSEISADSSGDAPRARLSSFAGSISEDEDYSSSPGEGNGENFHKDAVADISKTLSENGDFQNTRVEFTSLRLSNNATDHHVHRAIAVAFSRRIAALVENGLDASKAVAQTLNVAGAVAFLADVAVGKEMKIEDQVDFLLYTQKDLTHRGRGDLILFALCKDLYEREVLDEDGFEAWWADARSSETPSLVSVRGRTEAFMTWLRDAEEEDSDEDDD